MGLSVLPLKIPFAIKIYPLDFERKDFIENVEKIPSFTGGDYDYRIFQAIINGDINSSGYVVDTLEAALWCILQEDKKDTWKKSYADCLLRAVNLGDDADTVAAVTGGLAGIIYSFDSIPDDWVWKIRKSFWALPATGMIARAFTIFIR